MANDFRVLTFAAEPASTSDGSEYHIYTTPSSTTTVVIGLILTNIHTSQVTAKVLLESDTSGNASASSTQTNNVGAGTNSGNTANNNYIFPAQTCNSLQRLYVSLSDASGCVSNSSINGAVLKDTISPNIPLINDVSVNSNCEENFSYSNEFKSITSPLSKALFENLILSSLISNIFTGIVSSFLNFLRSSIFS